MSKERTILNKTKCPECERMIGVYKNGTLARHKARKGGKVLRDKKGRVRVERDAFGRKRPMKDHPRCDGGKS